MRRPLRSPIRLPIPIRTKVGNLLICAGKQSTGCSCGVHVVLWETARQAFCCWFMLV